MPSFFVIRHRRNQILRICWALFISMLVHGVLLFWVGGSPIEAKQAVTKTLEARLVTKKEVPIKIIRERKALYPLIASPEVATKRESEEMHQPIALSSSVSKSAAALPLPFDPIFYTWREVDVPAKLNQDVSPPYPEAAAKANISGRVMIEVWVNEVGKVDDIKIIEADPPGYFEEAILSYYRNLQFSPAMKEGKAKRYRTRFQVDFGTPLVEIK